MGGGGGGGGGGIMKVIFFHFESGLADIICLSCFCLSFFYCCCYCFGYQ